MTESSDRTTGVSRRTVLVGAAAVAALAESETIGAGTAARAAGGAVVSPFATVR